MLLSSTFVLCLIFWLYDVLPYQTAFSERNSHCSFPAGTTHLSLIAAIVVGKTVQ